MAYAQTVKIVQWNCRSLPRKPDDARLLLHENCAQIAAFSKTFLAPSSIATFPCYDVVSSDRNRHGGGVALAVAKHLKFQLVDNMYLLDLCRDNFVEIIAAKVYLTDSQYLHVFSIYSPPRSSGSYTHPDFWNLFFQACSAYDLAVICGDFNGRNPLWCSASSSCNIEGSRIELAVTNFSFALLNDGSYIWSSSDLSRRSAIDLTVVSRNLLPNCQWEMIGFHYGSDHYLVLTSVNNRFYGKIPCRP